MRGLPEALKSTPVVLVALCLLAALSIGAENLDGRTLSQAPLQGARSPAGGDPGGLGCEGLSLGHDAGVPEGLKEQVSGRQHPHHIKETTASQTAKNNVNDHGTRVLKLQVTASTEGNKAAVASLLNEVEGNSIFTNAAKFFSSILGSLLSFAAYPATVLAAVCGWRFVARRQRAADKSRRLRMQVELAADRRITPTEMRSSAYQGLKVAVASGTAEQLEAAVDAAQRADVDPKYGMYKKAVALLQAGAANPNSPLSPKSPRPHPRSPSHSSKGLGSPKSAASSTRRPEKRPLARASAAGDAHSAPTSPQSQQTFSGDSRSEHWPQDWPSQQASAVVSVAPERSRHSVPQQQERRQGQIAAAVPSEAELRQGLLRSEGVSGSGTSSSSAEEWCGTLSPTSILETASGRGSASQTVACGCSGGPAAGKAAADDEADADWPPVEPPSTPKLGRSIERPAGGRGRGLGGLLRASSEGAAVRDLLPMLEREAAASERRPALEAVRSFSFEQLEPRPTPPSIPAVPAPEPHMPTAEGKVSKQSDEGTRSFESSLLFTAASQPKSANQLGPATPATADAPAPLDNSPTALPSQPEMSLQPEISLAPPPPPLPTPSNPLRRTPPLSPLQPSGLHRSACSAPEAFLVAQAIAAEEEMRRPSSLVKALAGMSKAAAAANAARAGRDGVAGPELHRAPLPTPPKIKGHKDAAGPPSTPRGGPDAGATPSTPTTPASLAAAQAAAAAALRNIDAALDHAKEMSDQAEQARQQAPVTPRKPLSKLSSDAPAFRPAGPSPPYALPNLPQLSVGGSQAAGYDAWDAFLPHTPRTPVYSHAPLSPPAYSLAPPSSTFDAAYITPPMSPAPALPLGPASSGFSPLLSPLLSPTFAPSLNSSTSPYPGMHELTRARSLNSGTHVRLSPNMKFDGGFLGEFAPALLRGNDIPPPPPPPQRASLGRPSPDDALALGSLDSVLRPLEHFPMSGMPASLPISTSPLGTGLGTSVGICVGMGTSLGTSMGTGAASAASGTGLYMPGLPGNFGGLSSIWSTGGPGPVGPPAKPAAVAPWAGGEAESADALPACSQAGMGWSQDPVVQRPPVGGSQAFQSFP